MTIAVSLGGSESGAAVPDDGEIGSTADWLNRLLRSTSALLDSKSARTVLDTAAVRSMISRFGTTPEDAVGDNAEDGEPETDTSEEQLVDSAKEVAIPRLGGFEVMNRTIDIAQAALARHTLAAYPPDLLIEVPRSACRSLDFHRAAEVIEVGRQLTIQALDQFEQPRSIPLMQP
jgi:NTE family protein